jgi:2-polyprenyl-3-methyl-5-hydroxy-6-metoxy-1,4-benzoquinol methylase
MLVRSASETAPRGSADSVAIEQMTRSARLKAVRSNIRMANRFHEANRRRWDAGSASWARRADTRGIWRRCHLDPSLAFHPAELNWLSDIAGKRVAVLGSGDNQVAFALAGLGARVTSVDISDRQIEVAQRRAAALGLEIDFLQADVVDLHDLGGETFDLVYTGGHVAVWVSDLRRY